MSPIIDIQNLTFLYPDKVAIENLSLSIPHGGITALTGPNGAGKTTLMRCIAGLEKPLEGGVHVCGFDMQTQQRQAHARMGFLPDNFGLYDDLTVIENLRFVGQCHNISSQLLKQRLEIIVRLFSLSGILTEKCESLSRGWRQRVGIAMVTIHKPEILILDEPASGLDPESRTDLARIFRTINQEWGTTIIVSSHILSELEAYSTAMIVLRDGKLIRHIQNNLKTAAEKKIAFIDINCAPDIQIIQKLEEIFGHIKHINAQRICVELSMDREDHARALKSCIDAGIPVCGYQVENQSLQDLYLETTQQRNQG